MYALGRGARVRERRWPGLRLFEGLGWGQGGGWIVGVLMIRALSFSMMVRRVRRLDWDEELIAAEVLLS